MDRINAIHISSNCGIQVFLDQYDGDISEDDIIRIIECGPGQLPEPRDPLFNLGQAVSFKSYRGKIEIAEIEEIEWCFDKQGHKIQYWLNHEHVLERDICESVTPSTKQDLQKLDSSSKSTSTNDVPATERGPRLVKSTE